MFKRFFILILLLVGIVGMSHSQVRKVKISSIVVEGNNLPESMVFITPGEDDETWILRLSDNMDATIESEDGAILKFTDLRDLGIFPVDPDGFYLLNIKYLDQGQITAGHFLIHFGFIAPVKEEAKQPKKKQKVEQVGKKKEEKDKKEELLEDLDKLDKPDPDPELANDPEPELSIVDQFVAGDMDAVRQSIQDEVIKTVSDVVNGTPEPEPDADPDPDSDPEPKD